VTRILLTAWLLPAWGVCSRAAQAGVIVVHAANSGGEWTASSEETDTRQCRRTDIRQF